MRNQLEMRVDGLSLSQPEDRLRGRQTPAMREVNSYRVSDMANAAVLVFKRSAVPVACSLQGERHHHHGHKGGKDPAG